MPFEILLPVDAIELFVQGALPILRKSGAEADLT
jgi:hypothetical protein